jgi:hypothetical protein
MIDTCAGTCAAESDGELRHFVAFLFKDLARNGLSFSLVSA